MHAQLLYPQGMKRYIPVIVKSLPMLYKIFLLLLSTALIVWMFPQGEQATHYDYAEGGFWKQNDLFAPYDFAIMKSQKEIDKELAIAKSKSLLFFTSDSAAYHHALERLSSVTEHCSAADAKRMRKTLDSIYSYGYIEIPADMPDFEQHTLVLLDGNIGSEHAAAEFIMSTDIVDTLLRDSVLVPNIVYDANRTALELDSRLSQLSYSSDMIARDELVIAKGEYITPEKAQKIASLEAEQDKRFADEYHPFARYLGQILLILIAFVALYMFMQNTRHAILDDNRKITFVFTIIVLMSFITAMVLRVNPDWVLVVPLCIIPILMRIFFDMRVALYIHITTIVIIANLVPNSFEFIFYQLVTGMMSIITVKNFENRSKFFVVSGVIFLTYSLIYTCGILSQDTTLQSVKHWRYAIFFLNALLTLMAHPLIYVFERLFKMTTNLTLMELSSTNTPALRELSRQAPGTFQHSMQVANISEDLINEIGGNALLAKVGALYHDIGKTCNPYFFTENQSGDFNPHDELDYVESASIITQHVRDGVSLARKYHLPSEITDFIRSHHGTTLTGYFYAKQKQEHPDDLDEKAFRYPGPRPFSRETAVVMIVDSVEAACKSLKNHDKESIDGLVESIVNNKIKEDQLVNCDLTFADINKLKSMLKVRMLSIYHARVAYPVVK